MTQPYPAEAVERLRQRCDLASYRDEWTVSDVAPDDLAALLSYVEGMKWRPIESAPKDGTRFDVWYKHHDAAMPTPAHRVENVYWSDIQGDFCTDGTYGPEEPSPLMLYPRPTHWMPLPPAPDGEDER